jgi:hypothetical protein
MREHKRKVIAVLAAATLGVLKTARADQVFVDDFSAANTYTALVPNGNYTASDENSVGTWTAGGGTLSYARVSQNPPAIGDIFHYSSSVLLTNGATASTGNTSGLTQFTVNAQINDIPAGNTAQPGVIVSGSVAAGGYLISDFTGENNDFVLLAETGSQLVGDEGGSAAIVKDFGANSGPAVLGHNYSLSVTEDRSGANPTFSVTILDLGPSDATIPPDPTVYYSGIFQDMAHTVDFGGTQIGYRARDAHDEETSEFGSLSLSIPSPEPGFLGFLLPATLFSRRRNRPARKRIARIIEK